MLPHHWNDDNSRWNGHPGANFPHPNSLQMDVHKGFLDFCCTRCRASMCFIWQFGQFGLQSPWGKTHGTSNCSKQVLIAIHFTNKTGQSIETNRLGGWIKMNENAIECLEWWIRLRDFQHIWDTIGIIYGIIHGMFMWLGKAHSENAPYSTQVVPQS